MLVHCAMGKSRSATIIIAYLLWRSQRANQTTSLHPFSLSSAPTEPISSAPNPTPRRDTITTPDRVVPPNPSNPSNHPLPPLTPETALTLLRQCRPLAEPNDGFMSQLHLYYAMGCPDSIDTQPRYQRWLYQKVVQQSLEANQPPELAFIRFEDEHEHEAEGEETKENQTAKQDTEIKCRKCRRLLAQPGFLVAPHRQPPPTENEAKQKEKITRPNGHGADCAHLFLHPLSWMRGNLADSQLDGRLSCPNQRCGANVGKFAWQGLRCSCGAWVTPGFALARGRVDEVAVLDQGKQGAAVPVRLPPELKSERRFL